MKRLVVVRQAGRGGFLRRRDRQPVRPARAAGIEARPGRWIEPGAAGAPGSEVAPLASAALFFTVVMWSQQVFHDRPTTGFTLTVVFIAAGFIIGPSSFGVLATRVGRPVALLTAAVPALLVALVPPSRDDPRWAHAPDRHGDAASV